MRWVHFQSNQIVVRRRADSLKRVLVRQFGVPSRALETVGYGKGDSCLFPRRTKTGAIAASPCAMGSFLR